MNAHARLEHIAELIAAHIDAGDEVKRELHELLPAFDGLSGRVVIYREKICDAISSADIYFDPQECVRYGGRDEVRARLQSEISEAMKLAQELQRGQQNGGGDAAKAGHG